MPSPQTHVDNTIAGLVRRLEKLEKINAALMQRVERSMDQQANAYSLFQTAIGLEAQVRVRTEELKNALNKLELANDELVAARDAAERANRFKTRFFTAVGHDLLQPLHAARLSLSAMSQSASDPSQERLARQVDHALTSIEDLLRTILDLSKLEAGTIKPALQAVPLDVLFRTLIADLEPIARARNLCLTFRHPELAVRSDPMMLRRILLNLLANAVNYTGQGQVLLAARKRGSLVHIEVWDTGPGIDPAEQQRIFEEFQRGSASSQAGGTGFGLGLSIVRRMAEALGHRITVCSRPERGTRFTVVVPVAMMAELPVARASEPAARSPYGFAGRAALVIDNDGPVLDAMACLLESWSCEAAKAQTLSDVDAILAQTGFRPDIVLADYHLDHGETGLAAVARVRERLGPVPGVIITADHSPGVAERAYTAGCEILKKPVRPAELRALMLHLLK